MEHHESISQKMLEHSGGGSAEDFAPVCGRFLIHRSPIVIPHTGGRDYTAFYGQESHDPLVPEQKILHTAEDCAHIEIRVHEPEAYAAQLEKILP